MLQLREHTVYRGSLFPTAGGGQSVSTEGRSVNPSLTNSRFAGGLTTDGNIETVRNTDGISAD